MIGFTSTSLRKNTVSEIVEIAVKAGADAIEWGSDCHIKNIGDAENAKRLCDENGIIINSYGTYYRIGSEDRDEQTKICKIARCMGAGFIRTWLGVDGSADTDEKTYKKILEDAQNFADIAKAYGLTVCNECHPHTFNDTTASALKFLNDVKRDNVETYYQSWYTDEAGDYEKLVKTFDRVRDVHISFSELEHFQCGGVRDGEYINKILSWLASLGFDNTVMIEFVENSEPENLIKDVKKLRTLWNFAKSSVQLL